MEYLNYYKKYIILTISILLFLIVSFYLYHKYYTNKKENINKIVNDENVPITNNLEIIENSEEIIDKYYVDIKGQVVNPGVYEIDANKIVNDAIILAGGLTNYADTSCINLSKKIADEMVIYVYNKSEVWKLKEKEIKKENIICDNLQNDIHIENNTESLKSENVINDNVNNLININKADLNELTSLDGIGEAKAKAIIEYRKTNGDFSNIEDIKNVSGIGDSVYNSIKSKITIE